MTSLVPADAVLLAPDWKLRALLRAQLLEEGVEVLATDTWPDARRLLRPGLKPRSVIVDVQGLGDAGQVLRDLKVLMDPGQVLVLTALAALPAEEIAGLGFRNVIARPSTIADIVRAVRGILVSGS